MKIEHWQINELGFDIWLHWFLSLSEIYESIERRSWKNTQLWVRHLSLPTLWWIQWSLDDLLHLYRLVVGVSNPWVVNQLSEFQRLSYAWNLCISRHLHWQFVKMCSLCHWNGMREPLLPDVHCVVQESTQTVWIPNWRDSIPSSQMSALKGQLFVIPHCGLNPRLLLALRLPSVSPMHRLQSKRQQSQEQELYHAETRNSKAWQCTTVRVEITLTLALDSDSKLPLPPLKQSVSNLQSDTYCLHAAPTPSSNSTTYGVFKSIYRKSENQCIQWVVSLWVVSLAELTAVGGHKCFGDIACLDNPSMLKWKHVTGSMRWCVLLARFIIWRVWALCVTLFSTQLWS